MRVFVRAFRQDGKEANNPQVELTIVRKDSSTENVSFYVPKSCSVKIEVKQWKVYSK